jgi:Beta-ketoacyl synthase, C-terminal domain/Beta-ketoacyl synthase, N-terminal domain
MNPDGRCYVFDSRGDGYARGEGVSTVILKRLDQAIADGDQVHAVILNSGVNQDGKTGGITLPSGEAQASLMKSVYANAGLNPAETLYVEAHGTVCARPLVVVEFVYGFLLTLCSRALKQAGLPSIFLYHTGHGNLIAVEIHKVIPRCFESQF